MTPRSIKSITVLDELSLQSSAAVEVMIDLNDGSQRWCFFANTSALNVFGDWIEGTETRFHFGVPHMIVV